MTLYDVRGDLLRVWHQNRVYTLGKRWQQPSLLSESWRALMSTSSLTPLSKYLMYMSNITSFGVGVGVGVGLGSNGDIQFLGQNGGGLWFD